MYQIRECRLVRHHLRRHAYEQIVLLRDVRRTVRLDSKNAVARAETPDRTARGGNYAYIGISDWARIARCSRDLRGPAFKIPEVRPGGEASELCLHQNP